MESEIVLRVSESGSLCLSVNCRIQDMKRVGQTQYREGGATLRLWVRGGPGSQVPRLHQVHPFPLHMYTIFKLLESYSRSSGMNTCVSTTISLGSSMRIEPFKFPHLEGADIFYRARKTLIILPFFSLEQSCILPISEPSSFIDTH